MGRFSSIACMVLVVILQLVCERRRYQRGAHRAPRGANCTQMAHAPCGVPREQTIECAWSELVGQATAVKGLDALLAAKASSIAKSEVEKRASALCNVMHDAYLEHLATAPIEDLSDDYLRSFTRYTDGLPLKDYENCLDLVPALVNLVSLADALPLDGSSLPFDLKKISTACKSAVYFAPRRFTAVQLAFDEPRSRVLLFHTGRIVGTGYVCASWMDSSARPILTTHARGRFCVCVCMPAAPIPPPPNSRSHAP